MSIHQLVFLALWLSICGYAYVCGGLPERIVATLFIVGALASSLMFEGSNARPFGAIEIGVMAVDTAMFVLLFSLAMASSRYWPLAMASLQGAEVVGHLARLSISQIVPPTYFMVTVMWSFPMLLLLGVATWRHRRRLRRYGLDHNWSWQLPMEYRSRGFDR